MGGVATDVLGPHPASLALLTGRAVDTDDQAGDVLALVDHAGPPGTGVQIDTRDVGAIPKAAPTAPECGSEPVESR